MAWFVADRLALGTGLLLSYQGNREKSFSYYGTQRYTDESWKVGLQPLVRYYLTGAGKHRVFAQAEGILGSSWTTYWEENNNLPPLTSAGQEGFAGWTAGVGYNYFVSANAALEALAVYQRYYESGSSGRLNLRLGLSIFLPGGAKAQ